LAEWFQNRSGMGVDMKWFSKIFCTALMVGFLLGASSTRADLEVSADVRIHSVAEFEAPLAPYGSWVTVGSYGRCWHPARVEADWRPYCDGHWEWTDCGWYWASDEPWGWACYHYGNWTLEPTYGWIWVPGIEWAPAWVSWRFGEGFCGWAPLAPRGIVLAPAAFVFVEERRFREHHRPNTVVVNNTTIINKTKVINNIKHENREIVGVGRQRVVVNEGPGAAFVERGTGQRISPRPIREVARQTSISREAIDRAAPAQRAEPNRSQPATPPVPPETRAAQSQPRTVQPDRNAAASETRTPGTPVFPETRIPQPETRTAPPMTRTVPETRTAPPQVRTDPPAVQMPSGERSQVRGRGNLAPAPRPPAISPRETERRSGAGGGWRRE
jgi:hypothetical protein